MIYIYRHKVSDGAVELARALEGQKIRDIERVGLRAGDRVICWGESLHNIRGVKILNGGAFTNKLQDALKLKEAGVATVDVSKEKPRVAVMTPDSIWETIHRYSMAKDIAGIKKGLDLLEHPLPIEVWLPRRLNHVGGHDLLNPPAAPDFYSKKEALVEEYRIHIFGGKSIRSGKKIHREGVERPHEWIRSLDAGWRICYDGFTSTKPMRELAAKAVKALGLDFGAVDLGKTKDDRLLVLEVNRAPGLEGNTIVAYASAIEAWMEA